MDITDLYFEIYKDQIAQGRHLETQRLEVTKFILAVAAALVGLVGTLKFSIYCIPPIAAIIGLGCVGLRFVETYADRFDGHMRRARAFRKAADGVIVSSQVEHILSHYPVVKSARIRTFWRRVQIAIIAFGVVLLLTNILKVYVCAVSLKSAGWFHHVLSC